MLKSFYICIEPNLQVIILRNPNQKPNASRSRCILVEITNDVAYGPVNSKNTFIILRLLFILRTCRGHKNLSSGSMIKSKVIQNDRHVLKWYATCRISGTLFITEWFSIWIRKIFLFNATRINVIPSWEISNFKRGTCQFFIIIMFDRFSCN